MGEVIVTLTDRDILAAGSPEGIRAKLQKIGFPIIGGLKPEPDYANYTYNEWRDPDTGLNYFKATPKGSVK